MINIDLLALHAVFLGTAYLFYLVAYYNKKSNSLQAEVDHLKSTLKFYRSPQPKTEELKNE